MESWRIFTKTITTPKEKAHQRRFRSTGRGRKRVNSLSKKGDNERLRVSQKCPRLKRRVPFLTHLYCGSTSPRVRVRQRVQGLPLGYRAAARLERVVPGDRLTGGAPKPVTRGQPAERRTPPRPRRFRDRRSGRYAADSSAAPVGLESDARPSEGGRGRLDGRPWPTPGWRVPAEVPTPAREKKRPRRRLGRDRAAGSLEASRAPNWRSRGAARGLRVSGPKTRVGGRPDASLPAGPAVLETANWGYVKSFRRTLMTVQSSEIIIKN